MTPQIYEFYLLQGDWAGSHTVKQMELHLGGVIVAKETSKPPLQSAPILGIACRDGLLAFVRDMGQRAEDRILLRSDLFGASRQWEPAIAIPMDKIFRFTTVILGPARGTFTRGGFGLVAKQRGELAEYMEAVAG